MKIGEAVKKSFVWTGKNLGLVWIFFCFNLIGNLLNMWLGPQQSVLETGTITPGKLIVNLLLVLAGVFLIGGALAQARDFIKTGSAKIGDFVQNGRQYYLRILGYVAVRMIFGMLVFIIAGIIIGVSILTNITPIVIVFIALALVFAAIGTYVLYLMFLTPYIIVSEPTAGVFGSLFKSIGVIRKTLTSITGLVLLLTFILFSATFLIGVIGGLISLAIKGIPGEVVNSILLSGVTAYITIVWMFAVSGLYLSLGKEETTGQTG